MKIGLVCPMLSFVGGVQRHTLMLGAALERRGIEVVYFSPAAQNSPGLPPNHVQLGAAVVLPNFNGSWNDYSVTTQPKEELANLITDLDIDILHFQALVVPFVSWQLLEASPVINVATLHSGWEKGSPVEHVISLLELLVGNLKQKLTQTIAISRTALMSERYFSDAQTVIIPNPISIAEFQASQPRPLDLDGKVCNLLFVGRLDKRKGFLQLLTALNELSETTRTKLVLHTIGSGPEERGIRQFIADNGLKDRVILHGSLPETDKIAYLQHADIFVAPSLSGESFGIVLTEAMAAGLPIICGNNVGYRETMQEYPAPELVIDPHKPRVFARAIEQLAADLQLRQKLSKWGKNYVKRFDIETVVDKHIKLYKTLLANR